MIFHRSLKSYTRQLHFCLNALQQSVFECFTPEYPHHLYVFERRLHRAKKKYFKCMQAIQSRFSMNQHDLHRIDHLFDTLMACAQLRRRVSDYTIFTLCQNECDTISRGIERAIHASDTTSLTQSISKFDHLFHHILLAVAKEPLAFVLFISELNAFVEGAGFGHDL